MAKTKSTGRRKKNRSGKRKGKGKGKGKRKLDIVKLINVLEQALSNVREGESIYKESNGKELINKLYNDLAKLTKSKGSKNKLIKKLKIICQKMYNIISSSIHPNLLQDLNNFATKKSRQGPSFKILKGGVYIPGLSEAAAAFVVKQTAIAIATAATYVLVKTAMAYSVQYEATENIKKQTKEATNKAKRGVEEQLRKAGFDDEDIARYSMEIGDRLNLPEALREIECQNNGGAMRLDGLRRRCVCDPKKLTEGTNCHSIVTGVMQDSYNHEAPPIFKYTDYGPPVPNRIKSQLFLEDAERNLRALALPSGVSSANAIPRGELVNNGHTFSATDLVELNNEFEKSEGGPVHLPERIKDKLGDNIGSTQVSNWEEVFIEIELGDGLSYVTPTVIMRMLNNLEISIRKISTEIAAEAMIDIGKRIERVTDVGTGGTTYGWLTMFTGPKKKRTKKMVASWKRQKASIKQDIQIRKDMVKLIYNDLVRAFEDIIATFDSASEDVEKLWADAQWGVLTLGATVLAKEAIIIAIFNEMNNHRLGQMDGAVNPPMLELMDGLGKKKTKKRKGGKRNKITRRQFK